MRSVGQRLIWIVVVFFAVFNDAAIAGGHGGGRGSGFGGIIVYLGVATLLCLLATFIVGRLIPQKRRLLVPWHRRLGTATLVLALIHGTLALLVH